MKPSSVMPLSLAVRQRNDSRARADMKFEAQAARHGSPLRCLRWALRNQPMDRQTVSIMKACQVVGVSRRTIYNWISAGKVEYVRTAGGQIRIFADSLWRPVGDAAGNDSATVLHRLNADRTP